MTVQFNLFGGTVLRLETAKHFEDEESFLKSIDDIDSVGCFALTELGFGNNAVQMQTTAELDEHTDEWVITTPTTVAKKYWITNGKDEGPDALLEPLGALIASADTQFLSFL